MLDTLDLNNGLREGIGAREKFNNPEFRSHLPTN